MKAIILGDVHIGKSTQIGKPGSGKELNSRISDQIYLLSWVLEKAIELNVYNIIITGDIYEDPRPHPTLIKLFMEWLKKCEHSEINVHIVVGNHDIIRTGAYISSALDIVPAVELSLAKTYKDITTITLDDINITLLPYRDRRMYEVETTAEALDLLVKEIDKATKDLIPAKYNISVGHFAIEGSIGIGDEIDDELNEIFCPHYIFKNWDYSIMGHVHNPQVMHKWTPSEPYTVSHIGSMDKSDFHKNEINGQKIIVLLDSESSDFYKEIPLPNRSLFKIEVSIGKNNETNDYLLSYLKKINEEKSLKNSIIKLEVHLHSEIPSIDRAKIQKALYEDFEVHYICYFSESRILEDVVLDSDVNIDTSFTPEAAIEAYWDSVEDLSEEDKETCRALAKKINKTYEEENKEI